MRDELEVEAVTAVEPASDVATVEQAPLPETPAEPSSSDPFTVVDPDGSVRVITDVVATQRHLNDQTGRLEWRNAGGDLLDVRVAIFPK